MSLFFKETEEGFTDFCAFHKSLTTNWSACCRSMGISRSAPCRGKLPGELLQRGKEPHYIGISLYDALSLRLILSIASIDREYWRPRRHLSLQRHRPYRRTGTQPQQLCRGRRNNQGTRGNACRHCDHPTAFTCTVVDKVGRSIIAGRANR